MKYALLNSCLYINDKIYHALLRYLHITVCNVYYYFCILLFFVVNVTDIFFLIFLLHFLNFMYLFLCSYIVTYLSNFFYYFWVFYISQKYNSYSNLLIISLYFFYTFCSFHHYCLNFGHFKYVL